MRRYAPAIWFPAPQRTHLDFRPRYCSMKPYKKQELFLKNSNYFCYFGIVVLRPNVEIRLHFYLRQELLFASVEPSASTVPRTVGFIFRISTQIKNPEQQKLFWIFWSECRDSNSRPLEPHSSAIPNFATPGNCLRLTTAWIYYHTVAENASIFLLFNKNFYSPASPLITLPRFHRQTTCCSASFFCSSVSYST